MPKITTKQTVKTEVTITPKVKRQLMEILAPYATLSTDYKRIKVEMSNSRNAVLDIGLGDVGEDKFEVEGFKIALVTDAETSKLDQDKLKKLLLAKTGVSLAVIEDWFDRCTKRTPTAAYAKISPPGERE